MSWPTDKNIKQKIIKLLFNGIQFYQQEYTYFWNYKIVFNKKELFISIEKNNKTISIIPLYLFNYFWFKLEDTIYLNFTNK